MKNIVLIGFMGTGKTSIAKALAARLGRPYLSTDARIEQEEGRPIREIFTRDGEAYFRSVERRVVDAVSRQEGAVIDCGGGVVLRPENLRALRSGGTLICLTSRPEVILERTGRTEDRPLLNVPDPRRRVQELLSARAPLYAQADHMVDTSDRSIEAVVDEIEQLLKEE